MRTIAIVALVGLSSLVTVACAVDSSPEPTGESASSLQSPGGPSTGITVDCNDSSNGRCYECRQPDGVMCCLSSQPCTVIDCFRVVNGKCTYTARTGK